MLIRVEEIKPEGLVLDLEELPEAFPALIEMNEDGNARFQGPIQIHLRIFRVQQMVEVEGRVSTMATFSCSRCLAKFDFPIEEEFACTFTRQLPEVYDEDNEEAELQAEDLGLILYEGDHIDLTEEIQEQVIMGLPVQPLCSEDCKGLCPTCGVDLNQDLCSCDRSEFSIKFSALKDFKVKE